MLCRVALWTQVVEQRINSEVHFNLHFRVNSLFHHLVHSATRYNILMYPYFLFAAIHHLNRPRLSLSSWSLDAGKTGDCTKRTIGKGGGVHGRCLFTPMLLTQHPYPRVFCTLPIFAHISSPLINYRWQPVKLNDRHQQFHGKIGDCEQSRIMNYNSNITSY